MGIFTDNVEYELDFRGETKSDLARALDIPTSTVRSWWTRGSMPTVEIGFKVAQHLNIPLEKLLFVHNSSPSYLLKTEPIVEETVIPYTVQELELLNLYNKLKQEDKDVIKYLMIKLQNDCDQ